MTRAVTQVGDAAGPDGAGADARSVRPLDLGSDAGIGVATAPDVLAGWDVDGGVPARLEAPPFPLDTVVVGGAALVGGLLGAALGGRPRGRRLALGAVAGAVLAGAIRGVWRSP